MFDDNARKALQSAARGEPWIDDRKITRPPMVRNDEWALGLSLNR